MTQATPTIRHSEFVEQLDQAEPFDGKTIDSAIAWQHYQANPERWHRVTQDNPTGNPVTAMVLADGPWWVEQ